MRQLLYALVLALPTSLFAADWPIFRGNAGQTGVVADPLPAPLVERWKFRLGADKSGIASTESTAAIVGGVVFIGGVDDHVHAMDLATGAEKWKLKTGPIKAPLAAQSGVVYAGNMDGVLHCIDAATGKDRWHVDLGDEITSGINVLGENILLGCRDETLYCLSKTDGAVRWKFAINGGPVMGTPALVEGKTFAAGCDSTLHILNAADGKELSTVDLGGQVGASAAVRDGKLYVGTMSTIRRRRFGQVGNRVDIRASPRRRRLLRIRGRNGQTRHRRQPRQAHLRHRSRDGQAKVERAHGWQGG